MRNATIAVATRLIGFAGQFFCRVNVYMKRARTYLCSSFVRVFFVFFFLFFITNVDNPALEGHLARVLIPWPYTVPTDKGFSSEGPHACSSAGLAFDCLNANKEFSLSPSLKINPIPRTTHQDAWRALSTKKRALVNAEFI